MKNFDFTFREYYDLENSMSFLYRKTASEQTLPFLNQLNKEIEELKDKLIYDQLAFWSEDGLECSEEVAKEIESLIVERDYHLIKPRLIIDVFYKTEGSLNSLVFMFMQKLMWMHVASKKDIYKPDQIIYLWGYLFEYMMNYYERPDEKYVNLIAYACSVFPKEDSDWNGYRDNVSKGLTVLMSTKSKERRRVLLELSTSESEYIRSSVEHILRVCEKDLAG